MHASKDSRAALRWVDLPWGFVSVCLSVFPSIYPSVYFLSLFHRGAGGYFSSPPLPSPVLHCAVLHCTALHCIYSLSPPLLTPLTPHHTTAKEVPYYHVCNTTPRAERPPLPPPAHAHAHTHTHADVQCSPTQHGNGSTGIRKGVGVGVGRGRGVGTAGVCEALI
jgi:hypothetical protein